jgi:hypothetical protein
MGSHASVLTPMDRWRVIKYVKQLSGVSTNSVAQVESNEQETSNEDRSN